MIQAPDLPAYLVLHPELAAIPRLWLHRLEQNDEGTYGVLLDAEQREQAKTYELCWKQNRENISCIPAGTYVAERYQSPEHGWCFRLLDVPDRKDIELHIGCIRRDTRGCILLGLSFGWIDYADGKPGATGHGVRDSGIAFKRFMAAHPEQCFLLTITDPHV